MLHVCCMYVACMLQLATCTRVISFKIMLSSLILIFAVILACVSALPLMLSEKYAFGNTLSGLNAGDDEVLKTALAHITEKHTPEEIKKSFNEAYSRYGTNYPSISSQFKAAEAKLGPNSPAVALVKPYISEGLLGGAMKGLKGMFGRASAPPPATPPVQSQPAQ